MTTDNKTLADAQPGGRVRLGDQAEWARFEEWYVQNAFDYEANPIGSRDCALMRKAWHAALSAQPSPATCKDGLQAQPSPCGQTARCPVKHCGMTYARVPADGRCHACGASVQPSPGGQGDSRSEKAATFLRQYLTYLRSSPRQGLRPRWCDVYEALEVAIEALAARQPSKQPDSVALGEATEFCIEKGDRQLVGEPVADAGRTPAYDAIDRFLRNNMDDVAYAEHVEHLEALWAAVPAQAVDLGRWSQRHADDLHVAVHTALSVHAGSLSQKKRAAISAYVKRLLIDSQAVGNG